MGRGDGGAVIAAMQHKDTPGAVKLQRRGAPATGVTGTIRNVEKAGPDITVTNPGPQHGTDGDAINLRIQAHNLFGNPILDFTDNGTLPPGLRIDNGGLITDTLQTGITSTQIYTVTITVSDGGDSG